MSDIAKSEETMELRFFRKACWFSFWAALSFWFIVFFMKLPTPLWICTLGASLFSALLLGLSYKVHNLNILIPLYLIAYSLALSVGFFYNGGVQATVLFVYFGLAAIYLYVFPKHTLWFLVFLVINSGVLIWADYQGYVGPPPHQSKKLLYIDIWLAWSVCILVMGWIARFARNAFEEERTKAIELAQAKSRFLATMSHEIRTPLNGILGINSIALEKVKENPELRGHLELVEESAEHLLSVVNDILDYSKIEAGQMKLDIHRFDLHKMLERLTRSFAVQAMAKQIHIVFECDPMVEGEWLGDAQRIRQILYNLLSNALKFTEFGQVHLRVEMKLEKGERYHVHFFVEDTGVGIGVEDLGMLFEDFVQIQNSSRRLYGGTGLGLSICKSLVYLMGGKIDVRSQLGKGSCFHFWIPLEKRQKINISLKTAAQVTMRWDQAKVLLVEDNKVNQKVASAQLKKLGINPQIAENGQIALEILEKNEFDLILMDLEMPVLGGIEATLKIRSSKGKPYENVPIIALTAHALNEVQDRCFAAGMNSYLTKPLKIENLKEGLEKFLGEPKIDE